MLTRQEIQVVLYGLQLACAQLHKDLPLSGDYVIAKRLCQRFEELEEERRQWNCS